MSNLLIGAYDYTQASDLYTPSVSGGSFSSDLPALNMRDRRLHLPARTTDDAVASSVFTWDLGVARSIRLAALLSNISESGTVRVRGFTAVPVVDSLDFSTGWTATGTPVLTAAAATAGDGVPIDLVEDNDGASVEGYHRNVSFTGDGAKVVSFRVKEGTSAASIVRINDLTENPDALRLRAQIVWSAGTPTVTFSGSAGSLISQTDMGSGVWRIVVLTGSITAANTNELACFPANTLAGSTAALGSAYFGDVMVWDASSLDQLAYDSGFVLAIPSGLDAEERAGLNVWRDFIASENYSARYVRVNVNDTTNPDGFIDIYRFGVFGGFQPEVNMSLGASLRLIDATKREETDGGAAIFDERRVRRELVGVLEMMPESDAYGDWFAMQHRRGTHGQVYVCFDPADADATRWKRSFLATQAELSGVTHPFHARHEGAFRYLEEL